MHLFLIRHGETVDNVAGVYAGSRDSALTSHGVLQAQRLALYLAEEKHPWTLQHLFSSDLQRAVKTAEAIADEQGKRQRIAPDEKLLEAIQLECLREKDFGSDEGVRFGGSRGRAMDTESAESMRARIDWFIDEFLFPLLQSHDSSDAVSPPPACAVVAHGIILGVLYTALCERVTRGGLTLNPTPSAAGSLFTPPFWDNTGYLECVVSVAGAATSEEQRNLKLHVKAVNCTMHLKDLKKTRGGIGSSAYDEKQKKLTSFFVPSGGSTSKKRKSQDMS